MNVLTMPGLAKLANKVPGINITPAERGLPNGRNIPKDHSKRRKAAMRDFHATVQRCVPSELESIMQKSSDNGTKSKRAKKRRKYK